MRKIVNILEDNSIIQKDLDRLGSWERANRILFNADKYRVPQFRKSDKNTNTRRVTPG